MAIVNLKSLDLDLSIVGDNAIARTITLGQTVTVKDRVVIDSENFAVTTIGHATLAGLVISHKSSGFISAPGFDAVSSELFGDGAGAAAGSGTFGLTAVGKDAGKNITTGDNNVTIGLSAGTGLTSGSSCVSIGNSSMTVANADNQIAIGNQAMRLSNGANNTAIGAAAMAGSGVTPHTGQFNIAIGAFALNVIEGANFNNTAIGPNSGKAITTGGGNTLIGKDTGLTVTTGASNVFIGNATGDSTTTGSSNILIGAGLDTTAVGTTGELRIHFAGGGNIPLISGDMVTGKLGVNTLAKRIATVNVTTDSTDAVANLLLDQDDDSEEFVLFESATAASVANPVSSLTAGNTIQGFLKIQVNGTQRWLAFYDNPTS